MPFCKACGTIYTKSLGVCPKCNADKALQEQPEAPAADKRVIKRQWMGLLIGVPGMIAFITLLYYLIKVLKP